MTKLVAICVALSCPVFAQTASEYMSSITTEHRMSICRPLLEAKVDADGRFEVTDSFEAVNVQEHLIHWVLSRA